MCKSNINTFKIIWYSKILGRPAVCSFGTSACDLECPPARSGSASLITTILSRPARGQTVASARRGTLKTEQAINRPRQRLPSHRSLRPHSFEVIKDLVCKVAAPFRRAYWMPKYWVNSWNRHSRHLQAGYAGFLSAQGTSCVLERICYP